MERQSRWRPHWILHIDDSAGHVHRVLLRGYRNPGYTQPDEAAELQRLEREAGVLAALQAVPVKVPKYLGYNKELGWMLMEFVDGDVELTALADQDRLHRIYDEYVEELAKIHAFPIEQLDRTPRSSACTT